jgi:putative addiction module component (TIGR02574 family)
MMPDQIAGLAEILLASLSEPSDAPLEAEWDKEITRRLVAYDRGATVAIDAETVFAKARRIAR